MGEGVSKIVKIADVLYGRPLVEWVELGLGVPPLKRRRHLIFMISEKPSKEQTAFALHYARTKPHLRSLLRKQGGQLYMLVFLTNWEI